MSSAILATLLATVAPDLTARADAGPPPVITTLSNRADLVSGGDVLVAVHLPLAVAVADATVFAGERDVTDVFRVDGDRLVGLVDGLPLGTTDLRVVLRDGRGARLPVTNHPITGPVFSGPQTQPWLCTTAAAGYGDPLDDACTVAVKHRFVYRSTNPARRGFVDYDPANPPTDVATTTTDDGRTVPFVVRVETGVIGRGMYNVAVLWPPDGWTGKVLWPFGGDCKPRHVQDPPVDALGFPTLDPAADFPVNVGVDEAIGSIYGNGNAAEALSRGFMVANSALNKLGSQCNTVVSAEGLMMLKEHIIETYGPIRYTIGAGSSGGAMQQHQLASGYPGLLDGIQPMGSFPDLWHAVQQAADCHVLEHYFDTVSPHLWAAQAQRDAVTGSLVGAGCQLQFDGPNLGLPVIQSYSAIWLDPSNEGGCGLPADQVYDPATNPGGVRCTIPDYMRSVFGVRKEDGFANRPYDNVGVQYGLRALHEGHITTEQFVDLNEKVGGIDIDFQPQPARTEADRAALAAAYDAGLVTHGQELDAIPIIDIRGQDNVEIHSDFHTYVLRARLDAANGDHENQVVLTGARPLVSDPTAFEVAFELIDEWLAAIERDTSDRSPREKVRANRPAAAADSCWFEGQRVDDAETCATVFPYYGDARLVAGAPLTDDVLKCRLRPLRREDYPADLTDAQLARLRVAFPRGACDWSRPGVAQRPPTPWRTFAGGPGGTPLGPPPESTPL